MEINRAGETGNIPNRDKRFYQQQGTWFFRTREGADIGPFSDIREAKHGLQDFIDFLSLADPDTLTSFYRSLNSSTSAHA
jgi:hypothetical protein